ncbi:BTAD domain-containing putative transcriptional regulator [Streptomyces sp. SP17BM10]|uniref:AfsR/SARP family transcriptional regulator n=1 Tax=Streptomyces sp. SP17BM10 TaxID=3002530 RepID=UPI002E782CD0|nr:BTAD domain-containing putative transcriptional regulator [Streptomyces sp. SP17BM10]MEE1785264.1 BTAD domain-containing putative transcriptional regulator [Streptomyces sp. SP17BM10]
MACGDLRSPVRGAGVRLGLLGGFALSAGGASVAVSAGAERLLAFVALCCNGNVPRGLVAGSLWPDAPERCALASLRSALTRLPAAGRAALEIGPAELRLADGVGVDLRDARSLARRILAPGAAPGHGGLGLAAVEDLSADLLPGWYEDWALLEADNWRSLRLHALEALACAFVGAGRFPEAVAAAGAAVRADPLRESSQACLIRAHLAEGNTGDALQDVERYERRLRTELGLPAPSRLWRLVAESG